MSLLLRNSYVGLRKIEGLCMTKAYSVRLDDDIIKLKPADISLSGWLRQAAKAAKIINVEEVKSLRLELNRIGKNLNQLTRFKHSNPDFDITPELSKTLENINVLIENTSKLF